MKKIIKLSALILAVLFVLTAFAGCHKKNEIAFTIGDSEFTSAMYSCVLYVAANNARADIDTFIADNNLESENVKYETYKFDNEGNVSKTGTVSYNTFVRNEAIKILKQYATLDAWMAKNKVEVDEDMLLSSQNEAMYEWYYGCSSYYYQYYASMGYDPTQIFTPYGLIFEKNGVAFSTYEKYRTYEIKYSNYFDYIYGEGGEKEISKDTLTAAMIKDYAVADTITFSKKDANNKDLTDAKLKELKAIADKYADRLNLGEKFADIYKEEQKRLEEEEEKNNTSSSTSSTTSSAASSNASSSASSVTSSEASSTTSSATSSATTSSEDKGYTPENYVGIYGKEESSYEHVMFAEIVKQEVGKAVVLEDKENGQYMLVVRRDMTDASYEDYWFDNLRDEISRDLKQDEFDESLNTYGNTLALKEDTFATKPFGVEDIVFTAED